MYQFANLIYSINDILVEIIIGLINKILLYYLYNIP